ncbi:MAG TPA: Uma2 family endonuclease [Polyangiaceae bacterium]
MLATDRPRITFEEYCQIEADSPVKHEYLDGQAWAMAGGSREHAALCANVLGILTAQLRGGRCQAHTSDLRIRIRATGLTTYPDVSVICGHAEIDPDDRLGHTVVNPTLLVEVLSPSTADYDRGEKLEQYQRIESLREVVLVDQTERSIEVWRRADTGDWASTQYGEGAATLASISATLALEDVYRDPLSE